MKFFRIMTVIFIGYLSYMAYEKGVELRAMGTNADGDGIGISFLGIQTAERVPEANIPKHAQGFFVSSIILGISGLLLLFLPMILKIVPLPLKNWIRKQFETE
ncbi:hypothetical protein [Thalassobacillus pellis]|uniref:hypothetical protein n=1 Tax=Thalassobacillus pellis TaxID=748008 RepID=UPI0019614E4A|nr:hypothetical protein [Thalassobacillus pellis]MBM7553212.1 hypothetical protein [Thalassobacillus pellis]